MKKIIALVLCIVMVFALTGCKDYINRDYTSDMASERFDGLFDKIGAVLEKNGIGFNKEMVVLSEDDERVVRSYDSTLSDGTVLSIWLTYTFHEDSTGTESFYCSVELPQTENLVGAYPDAKSCRYFFEIGHMLSNIWSTGKSVREANKLVALVQQEVASSEADPIGQSFKKSVDFNEKYDLWDIGYTLSIQDDGRCDSTFVYEGLVNVG